MRIVLPLIVALALLGASPAHAATYAPTPGVTEVFVAYGTGVTRCDITLKKRTGEDLMTSAYGTAYSGKTDCTAPVNQTARARVAADGSVPALDGGLCSQLARTCTSGGNLNGMLNRQPLSYRITLRAPDGQGWVGAPAFCSGVGTDNLVCTFTANDVAVERQPLAVDVQEQVDGVLDRLVGPCTCPPID